ncbi:MAG: GFA family protein [Octadecabacter sp.]
MSWSGGCQCGAVRFRAETLKDDAHVCHCRMCQKATGNFFAPLVGVPTPDLVWTRGQAARFNSSDQVERGFCSACGTPLFFHVLDGDHWALMMGAFDDPATVPLRSEDGPEGRLPQIDQLGHIQVHRPTEECWDDDAQISGNRQHPDHDT